MYKIIQLDLTGDKGIADGKGMIKAEDVLKIFEEHREYFLDEYLRSWNSASSVQDYIAGLYDEGAELFDSGYSEKALPLYASFFRPILKHYRVRTVLDCACGTGNQAVSLALAGYSVTGSDLSSGMLRIAKRRAERYQVEIPFVQADFCRLEEATEDRFDAVICLTNSLSHLLTEADIMKSLNSMHGRLNGGGAVLIELLNYDDLLQGRPHWLPVTINQVRGAFHAGMLYVFDYLPSDIIRWFVVYYEQETPGRGVRLDVNIFDSKGIRGSWLQEAMAGAGFANILCGPSLSPTSLLYRGERRTF